MHGQHDDQPTTAARPDAHRHSEYGKSSTHAVARSTSYSRPRASGPNPARVWAEKATTVAASGCERRHSRATTHTSASAMEYAGHGTSSRRRPSATATGTSTATRATSHQGRGGAGTDGSAHRALTVLPITTTSVENGE